MTPFALALVLVAAFAHAGWNALSKRAPGGAAFVWTQMVVSTVCMTPVAAAGWWLDDGARVSLVIVLMGIVSGSSHAVYFVLLQRGYATGDLSLVYLLVTNITILAACTPAALRDRASVRLLVRDYRRVVVAVGVLSPFAYALVLFATRLAGVAYVAPAREVSILIGAVIGTRYYAERGGWQRLAGAAAIVGGVIALALG